MNIEIRILSGARKGDRIVRDATLLRVGTDSQCDIVFDAHSDPSAEGRSVLLRRSSDGWRIESTGRGEVLLNQATIAREMPIRTGDLVRLSEFGPDFSFALTTDPETTETLAPAANEQARSGPSEDARAASSVPETSSDATEAESTTAPTCDSPFPIRSWTWAAIAMAATFVLTVLGWNLLLGAKARPAPEIEVELVSDRTIPEGTELTLELRLKNQHEVDGDVTFDFVGRPPSGARIDRTSGVFTWKPDETQGPGQHTFRIRVNKDGSEGSTETTFHVEVEETNSAPVIDPVRDQAVDAGQTITFTVAATDPDEPPNSLAFRISNGPEWLNVNSRTGLMRCAPPHTAGGQYHATIEVSDDGEPLQKADADLTILVQGDPWSRLEADLQGSLFLLQVEAEGAERTVAWPLATCCAVGDRTLVTSAREVLQLAQWHRQGYQVWAADPQSGLRTLVREFRVPRAFVDLAAEPGDWIYVNFGLLETEKELGATIPLAAAEVLENLEEGQPLACCGFPHDGGKITRFDEFEPTLVRGEAYLISHPEPIEGPWRLLEIKMPVPQNMYGSPILSEEGRLVAIYGEAAPAESVGVKDLHYAPVVNLHLLESWLTGTNREVWVAPPPMGNSTSDQQESDSPTNRS